MSGSRSATRKLGFLASRSRRRAGGRRLHRAADSRTRSVTASRACSGSAAISWRRRLGGELGAARARLDELADQGRRRDRPCPRRGRTGRGLLLAAEGRLDEAVAAFEDALPITGGSQCRSSSVGPARSRRDPRRLKHRRLARETLGRALSILETLPAPLWAEGTRRLARIGGRSAPAGLTPTEQRVVALVVAGKANKEVAGELYLSVKTVEGNLSRIYRKLGVRSRTELAAGLGAER